MGMDVYGLYPASEVGEYFRNNVWWWHPLWNYVLELAPWVEEKVPNGHYNAAEGLDANDAVRLAKILSAELHAHRTPVYEIEYAARHDAMPDEDCDLCNGTGTRPDMSCAEGCNGCSGSGRIRPFATHYPFYTENVAQFRDFLTACGGFEIR